MRITKAKKEKTKNETKNCTEKVMTVKRPRVTQQNPIIIKYCFVGVE